MYVKGLLDVLAVAGECDFFHVTIRVEGRVVSRAPVRRRGLAAFFHALHRDFGDALDALQVEAVERLEPVEMDRFREVFRNDDRGTVGIRVWHGGRAETWHASEMIARNLGFLDVLEGFAQRLGLEAAEAIRTIQLWRVRSRTLVYLPREKRSAILQRAILPVPLSWVKAENMERMAHEMGRWLVRNCAPDGRLPYKVEPSGGTPGASDNTIRQLMATVCLGRYAAFSGDREAAQAAVRNLRFNLGRFYRVHDGVGVIAFNGSAKLGASAMAALAIYEQEGRKGSHASQLAALLQGIDRLWSEDGAFRTFHFPHERNDNQNFYPGEALVLWARLISDEPESVLLDRFRRSFLYYRAWHRAQPNPAFVPWHTQAYCEVYRLTSWDDLAAFVFEMNDWLLPMQQGVEVLHPDLAGRFFNPKRPEYGPPHASSTGVYLEGLADAHALAVAVGDDERAGRYAQAIAAGVRNLRTIQYKDVLEAFYVQKPERVLGGLRTNAYDNAIRIDNVQHGLAAMLKIKANATLN